MMHEQYKRITGVGILLYLLLSLLKGLCASASTLEFESGYLVFSRRLNGCLIKKFQQISLKKCLDECALHAHCQSINYLRRRLQCELNSDGNINNGIELSHAVGYVYQEILSPVDPKQAEAMNEKMLYFIQHLLNVRHGGPGKRFYKIIDILCELRVLSEHQYRRTSDLVKQPFISQKIRNCSLLREFIA